MKPFPVLLTQDLIDGLDALKERDGIPKNEAIRRAVREYLTWQGVLSDRPPVGRLDAEAEGREWSKGKSSKKKGGAR